MHKKKPLVLVTGKNGQLGWELQQFVPQWQDRFDFLFTERSEFDLSVPEGLEAFLSAHRPSVILNAGAYTAVDKAESEFEAALVVNGKAVSAMAQWAATNGAVFITISTDYVFKGDASSPYLPQSPLDPINAYGRSKAWGEEQTLALCPSALVVRTSWVYSPHGNNFVKTMLRLMRERPQLKVVADQVGSPTAAKDLAEAILIMAKQKLAGNPAKGIYHYANQGVTSWHGFALAIRDLAHLTTEVIGIPSSDYPTPAKRPAYSVLDCSGTQKDFGLVIPGWEESLQSCLERMS
ncbi:MAG: dTDP-4-dehydrorhamnose reductase [Sphingobacteriia bacterium]|nr:MAG: dTDP-4-dehydrorhamnose reductase [Sphingobacteriia bacterium]